MNARLRRIAHRLRDERGSNAVEMAISAGVLLTMLLGICQVSYAIYVSQFTAEAARETSRWAMVRGSSSCKNTPNLDNCNAGTTAIQTYAQNLNYPGISGSNVTATATWCAASGTTTPISWAACSSGTSNDPGNMVQVQVTYPLILPIPFSSPLSLLNISSTSSMVISQ